MEHFSVARGGGPPTADRNRIVIIKSDKLVVEAISRVAARCFPNAEINACHAGGDALRGLRKQPVYLALIGLTLSDMDGLDVLRAITAEHLATRRLIISGRSDERTKELLREMRVDGYFDPKSEGSDALRVAIRTVMDGRSYFSSVPGGSAAYGTEALLSDLTQAQLEVFAVTGGGCDEQQSADQLGISRNTVHTHLQQVMRTLGLQNRAAVMHEAQRRGIVRVMPNGRVLYPGLEQFLSKRARRALDSKAALQATDDGGEGRADAGKWQIKQRFSYTQIR